MKFPRLRSLSTAVVVACLASTALSAASSAAGDSGERAGAASGSLLASLPVPAAAQRTAEGVLRHPNARERVIVLLRHQPTTTGHSAHSLALRADTVQRSEAPFLARFRMLGASDIRQYHFIGALAADVTRRQAADLSTDPQVRAVVPDRRVTLPAAAPLLGAGSSSAADAAATGPDPNGEPGICPTSSSPQLEPEAVSRMHADSVAAGVDGAGVKVAVFPDGVDPTVADLQRAGSPVVGDYHDFTGEGRNARTGGGEAFGDVSSIAAQGTTTFDLADYVDPSLALPNACPIRIQGVAPGATVDVMKVFGSTDSTFDSVILQGLDWAVSHDHVDVLSESFGGNSVPQPLVDPVSLFNDQAVASGVLVVASTGDSGTSNTIGSPASSSRAGIISVGATTALRAAAQLGIYAAPASACWSGCAQPQGWVDDNVASLSSTGTTEYGPATVDVVAPGDAGWALCSADTARFADCADTYHRSASAPPIELFGGTSESAPLTAAAAALVIEAYRGVHGGDASPAPALVKRIIASTAQPLDGVPADEQGAGLVDAAAAVRLAQQVAPGVPAAGQSGLLVATDQFGHVGRPGASGSVSVPVTNTTATDTVVTPDLVTFSRPSRIAGGSFTYSHTTPLPGGSSYPSPGPGPAVVTDLESIDVPAGTARLVARASWSQSGNRAGEAMEISLIDPSGRIVNSSDPQGLAGFAEIEAASPQAGTWQLAFDAGPTRYSGPVTWEADAQDSTSSPAGAPVTVAPGGSADVVVPFRLAAAPGDQSRTIRLSTPTGSTQVSLLTRTTIPVTAHRAGRFGGDFTGGNGRQFFYSQSLPYEFVVPRHAPAIDVDLRVAHPGYDVFAFLVDPKGVAVDAQSTVTGRQLRSSRFAHLSWLAPQAGTWHLDLALLGGVRSQRTSTAVSGTVRFARTTVRARGLPRSSHVRLRSGRRYRATVTISNPGSALETYFLDPRLKGTAVTPLQALSSPQGRLPIRYSDGLPIFLLPPFSHALAVVAQATIPVALETFATDPQVGSQGYPDVVSAGYQQRPSVTLRGDLAATTYSCVPQPHGPTDTAVSRSNHFDCGAAARTAPFAATLRSPTGDVWRSVRSWRPVQLAPHSTRRITVTITPGGRRGRVVRGFVAVESFSPATFGTDVVARLPFAYRTG